MTPSMTAADFMVLLPSLLSLVGGLYLLSIYVLWPHRTVPLATVCSVTAFIVFLSCFINFKENYFGFSNLFAFDSYARFILILLSIMVGMVAWFSPRYLATRPLPQGEYYALLLFTLCGMAVMVQSLHLIGVLIGLEIFSFSLYILVGLFRENVRAIEASMKYLLLGTFASAFFLYGAALIYGTVGSLYLTDFPVFLREALPFKLALFWIGFGFLLSAFAFELSVVPFHLWAPDVYEGGGLPVTALMATAVKVVVLAVLMRFLFITVFFFESWQNVVAVLAVLSMTVGNLFALRQTEMKRFLAYSSISHVGYMLLGLLGPSVLGLTGLFYYFSVYTLMTLGVFSVLLVLEKGEAETHPLNHLSGLSSRAPFLAFVLTFCLLSLAGIPPTGGFFAKFFVIGAALQGPAGWLIVLLALINSVVAACYYLRVVYWVYFQEPIGDRTPLPEGSLRERWVLGGLVFCILLLGIFPAPLWDFLIHSVLRISS